MAEDKTILSGSFETTLNVRIEDLRPPKENLEWMLKNGFAELMTGRQIIPTEFLELFGKDKIKLDKDSSTLIQTHDGYGNKIKVLGIRRSKIFYSEMQDCFVYDVEAFITKQE